MRNNIALVLGRKIAIMLSIVSSIMSSSCSVKYNEDTHDAANEVPEFVFDGAVIERVEGGDVKVILKASALEQYKGGKDNYARDVSFRTMSGGEVDTQGKCDLLAADTEKEEYLLFGNIDLSNKERAVDITADSLKWEGKSEQLFSGEDSTLSIKKGGTVIHGKAFSASSISGTFAFGGAVSGEADVEESTE